MAGEDAVEIVHDRVPGRVRLAVPALAGRPLLGEAVAHGLRAAAIVRAADVRTRTGTVIVETDPPIAPAAAARLVARVVAAARGGDGSPAPGPAAAGGGATAPSAPDAVHGGGARGARWSRRGGEPRSPGRENPARRATSADETSPASKAAARPPERRIPWHALSVADVLERLGTDGEAGLSEAVARRRLAEGGPNRLPEAVGEGAVGRLLRQFNTLPVMLLAGSAVASVATGGTADAAATLAVVAVNGVMGFVTEGQAEHTIARLMDTSDRTVRVRRDGCDRTIAAADLVPGDLFHLAPGQEIAADGRLVAARGLRIEEAVLTGESVAVEKSADADVRADAAIAERATLVHAATLVSEGHGLAVAVATGTETEAALIQSLAEHATRPRARIEDELDRMGARLAGWSALACGAFLVVGWARGAPPAAILKDALALAVASIPEGLPAVATTTLSIGLSKLEKRGILVRKLSVVEQLGAVDTVCLDKTGTLTLNRMEVVEASLGSRTCALSDGEALRPLAQVAALDNDAPADGGAGASATEAALVAFAAGAGLDVAAERDRRPRIATLERVPGRPLMATLHAAEDDALLCVKGAPEEVIARSAAILEDGRERPLAAADRDRLLALNDRLAARPARVLAFARRAVDPAIAAPEGTGEIAEEAVADLVFLGCTAMVDPVRPQAHAFVRRLKRAGIRPVLITGDQSATAGAIARALEFGDGRPLRIIDSSRLSDLSPALLAGLAREADVFCRVSSAEKLAIVKALQASGHVVAMTGDGVNDGPALKAADVGIAMGTSGADLARDAANVIVRDDDLSRLLEAIAEGRAIFRNIRRAIDFLIATNMSEILVSIAEAAHGPGETETAMELLWINLVSDVFPGLGLALAEPDPDAMERPPRDPDQPFIRREDAVRIGIDGSIIAASALLAHGAGLARHGPGPATRGMTFLSLSLGQLLYTLVCQRTDPKRLEPSRLLENRVLDLSLVGSAGLAVLPFVLRPLGRLLGVAPLAGRDVAVSLATAAVPLLAVLARRGVALTLEADEGGPTDGTAAAGGAGPAGGTGGEATGATGAVATGSAPSTERGEGRDA